MSEGIGWYLYNLEEAQQAMKDNVEEFLTTMMRILT